MELSLIQSAYWCEGLGVIRSGRLRPIGARFFVPEGRRFVATGGVSAPAETEPVAGSANLPAPDGAEDAPVLISSAPSGAARIGLLATGFASLRFTRGYIPWPHPGPIQRGLTCHAPSENSHPHTAA